MISLYVYLTLLNEAKIWVCEKLLELDLDIRMFFRSALGVNIQS
jgi:hypothetical protein